MRSIPAVYPQYADVYGNPVARTPITHPYSFDEYVQWKRHDWKDGTHDAYNDRMLQWDYEKYKECAQVVFNNGGGHFGSRTPKEIERFLRLYFDDPALELVLVIASCNVSNGHPLWAFRWIPGKKEAQP